jgi:hypothetical protein
MITDAFWPLSRSSMLVRPTTRTRLGFAPQRRSHSSDARTTQSARIQRAACDDAIAAASPLERPDGPGPETDGGGVTSSPPVAASICHILREDPDLAEAVPATDRGDALRECIAPVARMRPGRWSCTEKTSPLAASGYWCLMGC